MAQSFRKLPGSGPTLRRRDVPGVPSVQCAHMDAHLPATRRQPALMWMRCRAQLLYASKHLRASALPGDVPAAAAVSAPLPSRSFGPPAPTSSAPQRPRTFTQPSCRTRLNALNAISSNSSTSNTTTTTAPHLDISELSSRLGPNDAVVLWFRNDLRVDDHPGLTAAAAACRDRSQGSVGQGARPLVPVYVCDPVRVAHLAFSPGGPEALSAALHRLRSDLRALGSDLAVRVGPWGGQLPEVVRAAGDRVAVVSEQEVEVRWRLPAEGALDAVPGTQGALSFTWRAPLWPASRFDVHYRTWLAQRGPPAKPLPPPAVLPPFPSGIDPGPIPSGQEMRQLLTEAALAAYDNVADASHGGDGDGGGGGDGGLVEVARDVMATAARGPEADRAMRVSAGPSAPLELLRQYLGTSPAPPPSPASASLSSVSIDEEAAALRRPGVDGAPFTGLFSAAKALGTLSARRVLKEAYDADGRPYGSVPPRRLRGAPAVAAAVAAEAADFHRALAVLDDDRVVAPGVEVHFWRWQGGLTDYCVAEPANPLPGAPAVLLVHGFGAFGDQWRGNMGALAAAGFRVFAPTFPGFGRSQKAAVPYSQDLWRDFLRDFTLQVVRAPVVVAGNSIGGFICTCLAADYPGLVRGLVLLNSAGPIDPSFNIASWRSSVAARRPAPPAALVGAVSSALFWYLERTVPATLRWLYPTNPAKADEWLQREILRAAGDSGAIDVFKSVWYLPPPRALNWLVKEAWRGPTLVLQGALDPLNDARGRARQMAELCPNVTVRLVEAGHCPHDEVPDQVNEGLLDFIHNRVLPKGQGEGQEKGEADAGSGTSSKSADGRPIAAAAASGSKKL